MKKLSLISVLSAIILLVISVSCSRKPETPLSFRINQSTGDNVSLLGFGCMRLPFEQDEVNDLIDAAIRGGVNYFDVAPSYMDGKNEAIVGRALARHKREDFFIATKMSTNDISFEAAKRMYENSFVDLQVDYIDYYLLHNVGRGERTETFTARFISNGVLDFLLEERKSGKIRNLGFSFHGDVAVFDTMFAMGIQWDFVMIQMNYVDWQNATGRNINAEYLYHKAMENNTQVIVMEPLLGGRLANLNSLAKNVLNQVNPNATPAEWAFRYAGSFDNVLTVLSGMNQMDHVMENLNTFSPLVPLNKEELEALAVVTQIMTTAGLINCTGCNYCVPCPFGVDIPNILLTYNTYISERKEIDKNDPVLQQAATCRGETCGLCEKECPQRIGIVKELARIAGIVNSK
jgi:predicted aldo/keto reductase-like oxidoreductase